MSPEMIVALSAFLGLVVTWVVLPTRSRSQDEDGLSKVEST
ncbi:MAG: hypothetical protein Q8P59_00935 [Dehalococcoidia bacterium]|nr:hypothetical protein [Dehalococcoidia bacterium]